MPVETSFVVQLFLPLTTMTALYSKIMRTENYVHSVREELIGYALNIGLFTHICVAFPFSSEHAFTHIPKCCAKKVTM